MQPSSNPLSDRVREIRKRRGMTQRDLAAASGLGLHTVKDAESPDGRQLRVKTLAALARGLHVTTADLMTPGQPEADPVTADQWDDVRAALYRPAAQGAEPPTQRDVLASLRACMPDLAENRYTDVRAVLPDLIRDAAALGEEGRAAQSRVLNATAWLLTQTRQWDDALATGRRALDAAPDRGDKIAAANTLCWCLLRQGRLAEAGDLAVEWADRTEPRISRASEADVAGWGKLWLYVANAHVRNNEPGAAADALRVAGAAAARIGREVHTDLSTTRTFGPVTVPMIAAENAVLSGKPDQALEIAERLPRSGLAHAMSASVLRHRLDVAAARTEIRDYAQAVEVMDSLRRQAPQWLSHQRYARDVLATVIKRRRTLTPQMRQLADTVRLPL
jgi:transcriptional regulator with XRE-family HTH domain